MSFFADAIVTGCCPLCGERTRKAQRWFTDMRAALIKAPLDELVIAMRDNRESDSAHEHQSKDQDRDR